jgi:hypothetical protein
MSTISVDTLTDKSAGESVDAADIVHGTPKAWINYAQSASPVLQDSYNVSSVSDDGAGIYAPNFTNAFDAAQGYCGVGAIREDESSGGVSARFPNIRRTSASASTFEAGSCNGSGTASDCSGNHWAFVGDLA